MKIDLSGHLISTTTQPLGLEIISASGDVLKDSSGKEYLDFVSGISVSNLGHQNPGINKAIKDQLDRYTFAMVFGEYRLSPQIELANKLVKICPERLDSVYLLTTGSECNEAAIKLARRSTGRSEVISFKGAYHGSTLGSLSISGNEKKKSSFRPLVPDVKQIRFNHIEDLDLISNDTAAVFIEPIQGDAGIRIPSTEFMKSLRRRCDETGSLLIFDEIQSGLGRTGKMFAFEHFQVVPDVLTLGKSLGGGIPLSALISGKEILECFQSDPELGHISTHGGNPLACAAAISLLDQITQEGFLDEVMQKSDYLVSQLKQLPFKKVRHQGFFIALEMENPQQVQKMVQGCLERGLISFWFLSCPEAFRLAPPLNVSYENLEKGIEIIRETIRSIN